MHAGALTASGTVVGKLAQCEALTGVVNLLVSAGMMPLVDARVVKLVDTGDLKSPDHCDRAGSSPAPGTIP